MKIFQFGTIRPDPSGEGTIGDFALHIQCPWRFVTPAGILTGSADYYEPPVQGGEVIPDDRRSGNLQRIRLQELFPNYDAETRSLVNESDSLTVISVDADRFGGFDLALSVGCGCKYSLTESATRTGAFSHREAMDPISFTMAVDSL